MAIQEDSLVCGRNGYRYRLEKEIGAGGEGRVYRIAGENLVAKIYKKAEPEVEKKIKLIPLHLRLNHMGNHCMKQQCSTKK